MKPQSRSRRKFLQRISVAGIVLGIDGVAVSGFAKMRFLKQKRIGIIGLDSSHAIEFTKILNDAYADPKYKGYKVTIAYPRGSDAIENSFQRIADNTRDIQEYQVRIASSIEELLKEVDAVMLETNDGHMHLEQALPVFKTGKPIFIDKPFAASLEEVKNIYHAAEINKSPLFSSSALRYLPGIHAIYAGSIGKVLGADVFSPAPLEKSHPDLFWYGIHGVEMLFALLGTGCKTLTRIYTADTDIITGLWQDGGVGVMRGLRSGKAGFGGTVYGDKGISHLDSFNGYTGLLEKIIDFFESGIPPVSSAETIEIYAFMEAADESKRSGGKSVPLKLFK